MTTGMHAAGIAPVGPEVMAHGLDRSYISSALQAIGPNLEVPHVN